MARRLGQRLVNLGTLGAPDDIYYLTGNELQLAVDAPTTDKAMVELVDSGCSEGA